jgi:uncharacterized protein
MPLSSGKSNAAFSHNVEVEMQAGKPQKQAVAIAYAKRREASDERTQAELDLREAALRGHEPYPRKYGPAYDDMTAAVRELREAESAGRAEAEHQKKAEAELAAKDNAPRLAMDRAPTMRTKDINGWLHVKDCRISKANVCPYVGREIPNSEKLGLDPDKIYNLYRDAAALEAAASSFERAPLMLEHLGVTAETAQIPEIKRKIIGAISNVRWMAPYLVADLTVWDGEGIEAIESTRQQELSPGYHYKPDMTPGSMHGNPFDGRMLEIVANHLCIVDTGRTGPDVMVNDKASQ